MGDHQNVEQLSNHAIQHLASHWHRYSIWCDKAHVPNVHSTLELFYEGVIEGDALRKVKVYFEEHYEKKTKG